MDPKLALVAEIAWSADRKIAAIEGDCESIFGRAMEVLVGKPLHSVLGLGQERAAELVAAAESGRPSPPEFVTLPKEDGPPHVLRLTAGRTPAGPRISALNLTQALVGAPPLQIARLSSSLSHEIRNPLSSVKMAVQTLARNTGLSERDQRRLTIANREVRTMERMLCLFSEYARDTAPNLEEVAARSVVQEALSQVEPELAERKVSVRVEEEQALPRVAADMIRVRPVLAQLILNVAHGYAEGAELSVSIRRGPEQTVAYRLSDPSVTVPAEERASLFEPFGSMLARNAGLSLASLHRVMLSHGGQLSAESEASRGTTYTLLFPVA